LLRWNQIALFLPDCVAAVWFFENNKCAKTKNQYVHFSKTMAGCAQTKKLAL
jgi:hypothetical protein